MGKGIRDTFGADSGAVCGNRERHGDVFRDIPRTAQASEQRLKGAARMSEKGIPESSSALSIKSSIAAELSSNDSASAHPPPAFNNYAPTRLEGSHSHVILKCYPPPLITLKTMLF